MGKLVCIGGGEIPRIKNGIQLPYETKEIDEEIVRISGKQNPKLLFIGTASSNSFDYFLVIKKIYEDLGCIVSNLDLLQDSINMEQIEKDILNSDIIHDYLIIPNDAMVDEYMKNRKDYKKIYKDNTNSIYSRTDKLKNIYKLPVKKIKAGTFQEAFSTNVKFK